MSLSEIILLVLLFIFFLRSPGEMWFAFLHTPHFIRGWLGFKINKAVPRSYDIVERLKPEEGQEKDKITFEGYEAKMKTVILTELKKTYEKIQSKLKCYSILTIVCLILDTIDMIV